ncbi:hypothetical protein N0V83_005844 [Neocucurbitaria cava]|uniref:Protein kinase domain-containing protein n=1 Tax=Neocucurbitaria cava TaxID=798079 RepID=A0A9W9CLN4_9PLEO|nr:hypothetical protein N0V83_005844 [Neocucurbitaria cava]
MGQWEQSQQNDRSRVTPSFHLDGEASGAEDNSSSLDARLGVETTPSTFLDEKSRIVAILVPKFPRVSSGLQYSSSRQITLLWEWVNQRFSYYRTERISLPQDVLSCNPCIITCIDRHIGRDSEELIVELFKRGYGGATFEPDFARMTFFLRDNVISNITETELPLDGYDANYDGCSAIGLDQSSTTIEPPHSSAFDWLVLATHKLLVKEQSLDENSPDFMTIDDSSSLVDNGTDQTQENVYRGICQIPNHNHQRIGQSPMSNFASPMSFITASSPATFISARSAFNSPAYAFGDEPNGLSPAVRFETIREDEPPEPSIPGPLQQLHTDYYASLHQQNIIQPFDKELNWSGKGQHVTFKPQEPVPLPVLSHLGSSMMATVEKVLCRRIALARKTMRCSRKWTVADALREVYHLQNLRHFHIVQLVGSYLQGRNFSILMYPVADYHLGIFLEDTQDLKDAWVIEEQYHRRRKFLASTLGCLTSAVAFIHRSTTKHMDIKPQNILVRDIFLDWRIYIADFGLSRSFAQQGHSQTDGPTSRTPRYCAPEVYNFERRGRSADIFSLGCVFLEILTVYNGHNLQDFTDVRRGVGEDESFHANLGRVEAWVQSKISIAETVMGREGFSWDFIPQEITDCVTQMISEHADRRPTAVQFMKCLPDPESDAFSTRACCGNPPEQYEAYQPSGGIEAPGVSSTND